MPKKNIQSLVGQLFSLDIEALATEKALRALEGFCDQLVCYQQGNNDRQVQVFSAAQSCQPELLTINEKGRPTGGPHT